MPTRSHPDTNTKEGDDIYAVCIAVPSMSRPVFRDKNSLSPSFLLSVRILLSIVVDVDFAAGTE